MNDGVMLARPISGTVGEAERVCHVFPVPRGAPPERIAALCGASFGAGELERLDGPAGMPCERCLSRTRVPRGEDTVIRRLDLIERSLAQLQQHVDGLRVVVAELLDDRRRETD